MKIVALYSIKGGVGKTAAAVNLAYQAATDGRRTLIWDLDPQAAATFYFRVAPKVRGGGTALVKGRRELQAVVKGTDFDDLDLLPADFSYRNLDLVLEDRNKPTKQLMRLLRPLAQDYELVILDCPPSISLVSENIFRAADLLLVPVIPTTLSVRTLEQLEGFLRERHHGAGPRVLPFFSMADRRKGLHREMMETLPRRFPVLLRQIIPYLSEVERMGTQRAPVGWFAPGGRAAAAYRGLWEELKAAL